MKGKTCSVQTVAVFVKETVISTRKSIHTVCGDRGPEVTSAEFRQYCQDVGIKLEFASPNTPQPIGANERADQTILNIVRCFLADFLSGELMKTAVYLSDWTPHAALQNGKPYKALYGKDAYVCHLRVIGSRALMHEGVHTNKLEHRDWEGRLVGCSEEYKSYQIYNSDTRRVQASQNVIYSATPSVAPSLDERGFAGGS